MAEEFESVELEYSEDDIVYYIFDEDDNEIGFAIEEDGKEVEYYYDDGDAELYGAVDSDDSEGRIEVADLAEMDGEVVEMEIDEDAIDHYIFDEQGNEIGFAIVEDGVEIECFYQDDEDAEDGEDAGELEAGEGREFEPAIGAEPGAKAELEAEAEPRAKAELEAKPDIKAEFASKPEPASKAEPEEPVEHGYLYKIAQIVGHEGNKARKRAGAEIGKQRDKAKPVLDKARSKAEAGVDKAAEAVESGGKKLQEKKDEYDLGITREGVTEATADLNAIAKEGAATAKELKETYDDIMDSFGAFLPKSVRRKLP